MPNQNKMRERFEEYVRNNRVFVLGAGFSAGAGVPLTAELLTKSMRKFANECPDLFARVDDYAKDSVADTTSDPDYSAIDFSDLCTFLEYVELREYGGGGRWRDSGSREKLALRFYLAKTLVEHTPLPRDLPEVYVAFASELHEGDIIISFNWDPLLETSLDRLGKPYTYNFDERESIKLCKFHGSVNWKLGEPENLHGPVNTLGWQSLNFANGIMETEIYATRELLRYDTWGRYQPLGEVEPFLVLPGYGKAFDVRSNAVMWYKPDLAFTATHDVYIIGLSLAPDDFFIRSFFLSNLPFIESYTGVPGRHIHIINPDPKARDNYEFVLSKGGATLHPEAFSMHHVDAIAARRNRA